MQASADPPRLCMPPRIFDMWWCISPTETSVSFGFYLEHTIAVPMARPAMTTIPLPPGPFAGLITKSRGRQRAPEDWGYRVQSRWCHKAPAPEYRPWYGFFLGGAFVVNDGVELALVGFGNKIAHCADSFPKCLFSLQNRPRKPNHGASFSRIIA